jgi:hypothetical protein
VSALQSFFIRAKHWQVFALFALCWSAVIGLMIRSVVAGPEKLFENLLPSFALLEVAAILLAIWIWSIGEMLTLVVPGPLRLKVGRFRFAVAFTPFYLPVFATFFIGMNLRLSVRLVLVSYACVFLLHFIAIFCQVYSWYFISKSLALAERLRRVTFLDYQAYLLSLWFLPVGIWFIQPRINRLYGRAFTEQQRST